MSVNATKKITWEALEGGQLIRQRKQGILEVARAADTFQGAWRAASIIADDF